MTPVAPSAPTGYTRFRVGAADVVALAPLAAAMERALAGGTLYDYAARHPAARPLAGRGVVYAVPLPGDAARVVVRHSRHGGLLAPLTGDRFLVPTRAPYELRVALRLARFGVPTAQVVGYALYPAGPLLRRSDVATREIVGGHDLADALRDCADPAVRQRLLAATARLLVALAGAGAWHPDLNLKNVLVAPRDGQLVAYVLDVDRIIFGAANDPRIVRANLDRLARSARKLRERRGVAVGETELAELSATVLSLTA